MAQNHQYTIRGVPKGTDQALRRLSRQSGRSLNEVVIDLLGAATGTAAGEPVRYRDLDHLAGSWVADPAFDQAMEAFDEIDAGLWK